MRYLTWSIELFLLTALLLVASPAASREADREDGQGWMHFKESNGHIMFDVKVNGQTAKAVFDTGADASIISEELARRAEINLNRGDTIRVTGIHDQRSIPTSRGFTLEMAGQEVELNRVPVAPAPGFDVIFGRPMAEGAVVQIDYPNQRIRFINRGAVEFEGNVDMKTTRRGAPMVRSRILDDDIWMLLDTGNAGPTILKRKTVRHRDLEQFEVRGMTDASSGAVTTGDQHVLQIPGFKLGPYEFDSLLASYNAESNDGFDGEKSRYGSRLKTDRLPYDGILGYEVMKNFMVTMNLEDGQIQIRVPR